MRSTRFVAAAAVFGLAMLVAQAQDVPPEDDGVDLTLITGEVVEVDEEAGVVVVHVVAVEDQEVEHFDLEVWIDEKTVFENESDWEVDSATDLEGTLVDVEGFTDGDLFIADYVWVVEGPVEDEQPVETMST